MKLTTLITALAAAAVGGTALSGIAFADVKTAIATAGPAPVSISFRSHAGESGVITTLDDGHQIKTWNYSDGTVWVNTPWVDVRRCLVTSAVGSSASHPVIVTHEDTIYKDWALLYVFTANGSARASATVDVSMSCPASAVIATTSGFAGRVSATQPPRRH